MQNNHNDTQNYNTTNDMSQKIKYTVWRSLYDEKL